MSGLPTITVICDDAAHDGPVTLVTVVQLRPGAWAAAGPSVVRQHSMLKGDQPWTPDEETLREEWGELVDDPAFERELNHPDYRAGLLRNQWAVACDCGLRPVARQSTWDMLLDRLNAAGVTCVTLRSLQRILAS